MSGRIDRLGRLIPPLPRLLWGGCLIVLLLLQHRWEAQLLLALLFAGLARLAGKRIRIGYFLILAGSITLFNLLMPFGRVLFRIGPWAVTEGALASGLGKGLGIAGLVFISLFSVSSGLRLPGRFGGLLARTFVYYEALLAERKNLQPRALVISIDRLLERIHQPGAPAGENATGPATGLAVPPPSPASRPRRLLAVLLVAASLAAPAALLFWP